MATAGVFDRILTNLFIKWRYNLYHSVSSIKGIMPRFGSYIHVVTEKDTREKQLYNKLVKYFD